MLEEFKLHTRCSQASRNGARWLAFRQMIPVRVLHAKYRPLHAALGRSAPELVEEDSPKWAPLHESQSIANDRHPSRCRWLTCIERLEPSFAHHYFRNVIREVKRAKKDRRVLVRLLAYREMIIRAPMPGSTIRRSIAGVLQHGDDVSPREHVDIQAASQLWVDSSISKTANVPTNYPYEDFKDIYLYAHEQGLKGCTTFRFNPEAFQGVLVKEEDLKNTTYTFTLEDGSEVSVKGDEEIEYDGEMHSAANLFDAMKKVLREILIGAKRALVCLFRSCELSSILKNLRQARANEQQNSTCSLTCKNVGITRKSLRTAAGGGV